MGTSSTIQATPTFSYFSPESKERLMLGAGALVPGFRRTRVLYLHHGFQNETQWNQWSETRLVFNEKGRARGDW